MSTISVPTSIYRPKRIPKVLRRQAALFRLLVFLGLLAVFGLLIAWRNFTVQQLTIDVARQRSHLLQLEQEIKHLSGSIEAAAPYNEVAKWAMDNRGWKSRSANVDTLFVPKVAWPTPTNSNGASSLHQ